MTDWKIRLLALVAVVALVLSTGAVVTLVRQSGQREADRVASDLASCERGNDNRITYRQLAEAQRDYVDDVLDAALTLGGAEAEDRAALNALLQPARAGITEAIAAIKDVNCHSVIPGA